MPRDYFKDSYISFYSIERKHKNSEEHNVACRLRHTLLLEDDVLLLSKIQDQLKEFETHSAYSLVESKRIDVQTRLLHNLNDKEVCEYFNHRPPTSFSTKILTWQSPCHVWKVRLNLRKEISSTTENINKRQRWLIEDRWQSLRGFMYVMSAPGHLQDIPTQIIQLITRFLYF